MGDPTMKYFSGGELKRSVHQSVHRSVTSLFKGGWLDLALDEKFNFFFPSGVKFDCHQILFTNVLKMTKRIFFTLRTLETAVDAYTSYMRTAQKRANSANPNPPLQHAYDGRKWLEF